MKEAAHARWIARFDMEDLISAILSFGTVLGLGLIAAGGLLQWAGPDAAQAENGMQGINAFHFLLTSLQHIGSHASWSILLIRSGIAALLFTPYVRVVASVLYFAFVHRSWKHTILGSLVLAPLTYILFFG